MATPKTVQADATRGEVVLPIGGESYIVRFGMRFLHAFTKQHGAAGPSEGLATLETAPIETLLDMVAFGIKLFVPADKLPEGFDGEAASIVLDELSRAEQEQVFSVLIESIRANPIAGALKRLTA